MTRPRIVVGVLAHNEERRIARCLSSLPLGEPGIAVHVVVNGTTDRTAEIARGFPVTVHDWPQGGKSRSWNRFVLDMPEVDGDAFVFVDGDAELAPGSIEALADELMANPAANAASGLPLNGRKVEQYRAGLVSSHGLFGDLYALSGDFVRRLRASGIRLPEDLIGDDSLVGALAKTDLKGEGEWREDRVRPCLAAGFRCDPTSLASPASLKNQYRRMINYSVRHFQNRIVSAIMRGEGPSALPGRLADLYGEWLPRFAPRLNPAWWWFDRQALARMRLSA
jgi:glycosyltransferase involved in cell wall biosynthesis